MSNYINYINESLNKIRTTLDESGIRPILFVGSGLSRRYIKAPDWKGLLEILIQENPNIKYPLGYYTQKTNNDLPLVASFLIDEYHKYAWNQLESNIFPQTLYNATFTKSIFLKHKISIILDQLIDSFDIEKNQYSEELKLFSKLQPHAIITTNYDRFLEKVFEKYGVIVGQQIIKDREAINIGQILKIHGCVSDPDGIVISNEDYFDYSEKRKYLTAKLLTYFMEHPIFFIGYSVSDENIKAILGDIADIICNDSADIVENIWFVEWHREVIDSSSKPPTDKTIDLGNGKTIRVNYVVVNDFDMIFEVLYQQSFVTLDLLRDLQKNIYNVIKSRTVTNYEVDLVRLNQMNNENSIAEAFGFTKGKNDEDEDRITGLIGIGGITDPQQLVLRYSLRLSDVADRLALGSWYYADQLIKKVTAETGINIKDTNNIYHVDMKGSKTYSEHRYSPEIVTLLERLVLGQNYYIYNDRGEKIFPNSEVIDK